VTRSTANKIRLPDDRLLTSWSKALDGIKDDLLELNWAQRVLEELRLAFESNDRLQQTGGHFWEWARTNHAYATLIRVRREVDSQSGATSLLRVLLEVRERPTVITRRFVVARAQGREFLAQMLDDEFTTTWMPEPHPVDRALEHVNPKVIDRDILDLHSATEAVATYASRTVAHRAWEHPPPLKFESVAAALKGLGDCFTRYYELVNGISLTSVEPPASWDTTELYTFAWLRRLP
jgi:hypothetical protein